MMKLVKKGVFNKPGKLEIDLSMTHYMNMGKAIECCIQSDLRGIRTYNVADEEVYRMIEVLRNLFETIYGSTIKEKEINIKLLDFLAFFRIGGFTPLLVRALTQNMVLDISKIKNELGYASQIDFVRSLPDIQEWVTSIGGPEILKTGDKKLVWNE
jgi:nucleoside-diphosphate-sugar epimerase